MHTLKLSGEDLPEQVLDVPGRPVVVGRNPQCDVVLPDPQVSWFHLRMTPAADHCVVEDLDSTNGTWVDGRRIDRHALRDGETVSIGPYRMQWRPGRTAPSPREASEHTLSEQPVAVVPAAMTAGPDSGRSKRRTAISPLLGQMRDYRAEDIRGDLSAGLTVAAMLVPQGMAYAMLAGLPPMTGLYASMLPMVIYALLGTSRQVSVGPDALGSILVAIGVGALAQSGSGHYLELAILLALLIGVIQIFMGMARLGFLVNFLSYPVLAGFTSAAALTIVLSQLTHLLGIPSAGGYGVRDSLTHLVTAASGFNPVTLALGAGAILLLVILKRTLPRLPGPLVVVVLGTGLVWLLGLDERGVAVVGQVEGKLPQPGLPGIALADLRDLLPLAGAMALVGFAQSITVAKALAQKRGEAIDANRELTAIGLANLGGSVTQAYPVTGGFSRSAVNARAGARTQVSSLVTALLITLTVIFLLPLVRYLPDAALAAVIVVAAIGLIDGKEIRYLFRVKKSEGLLLAFTVLATLSAGIIWGLLLGIAASILLFITLNTRPHSAILGRLPGTDIFRNTRDFPEAETLDGLVVLRIDASFYFANAEFLKNRLGEFRERCGAGLRAIVLDASAINDLDSSADTALHQIARELKQNGIEFYVAGVKGPVRRVMMRSGLYELLGADHFFFTIDAAVRRYARTRASAELPESA